ncbi:integral membrane protein [Rutstroemia sp. NJR-2017a BBW]|nr:integral membrane protein [Rutstroemia sp. NJR-2017a BBW]
MSQARAYYEIAYARDSSHIRRGIKCSICLLLMRIFSTRKFRIAASIVMGLCIAWAIMTILIGFLICHPLDYNWNLKPPGSHCGNQTVAYGSVGVVDIITDTCILILPIPMVWRLQMPKLNKILLLSLLGFGLFTIIVTIVRVVIIVNTNFADFSYSSKGIFIWTAVNFGTGILVACCPLLRPFFERLSPKSLIRSIGTTKSINTSLTADTSRKHSKFSRLGEDSFPLHEMDHGTGSGGPGYGGPAHEENFLQAPGKIHSAK